MKGALPVQYLEYVREDDWSGKFRMVSGAHASSCGQCTVGVLAHMCFSQTFKQRLMQYKMAKASGNNGDCLLDS